jgi:hypothetical protein
LYACQSASLQHSQTARKTSAEKLSKFCSEVGQLHT